MSTAWSASRSGPRVRCSVRPLEVAIALDTNLGRAIGQGGRTTVRSVVSEGGRVITAFPYGRKAP